MFCFVLDCGNTVFITSFKKVPRPAPSRPAGLLAFVDVCSFVLHHPRLDRPGQTILEEQDQDHIRVSVPFYERVVQNNLRHDVLFAGDPAMCRVVLPANHALFAPGAVGQMRWLAQRQSGATGLRRGSVTSSSSAASAASSSAAAAASCPAATAASADNTGRTMMPASSLARF